MQELPTGSMLAVHLPESGVASRLNGRLSLAAVNAPELCVVSGPSDAVAALQGRLVEEKIPCRPLHTSHAFHSPMMDPILEPFAAKVRGGSEVQSTQFLLPGHPNVTYSACLMQKAEEMIDFDRRVRDRLAEARSPAYRQQRCPRLRKLGQSHQRKTSRLWLH